MKKKNNVINFVLALAFGIVAFIILVIVASSVGKKDNYSEAVWAVKTINKGTLITEENVNDYVTMIETNDKAKNNNNILNIKDIINKEADRDIAVLSPEPISKDMFVDIDQETKKLKDPVLIAVTASDFSSSANGIVRKGNHINIYRVDTSTNNGSENGDGDTLLAESVKVVDAFDSTGKKITPDDTLSIAVSFNIYIESSDQEEFAKNIADKKLSISIVD